MYKENKPSSWVSITRYQIFQFFIVRFGDQIVQINGQNCAGLSTDKALSKLKKSDPLKCEVRSYSNFLHFFKLVSNSFNIFKNKLVIRDRPFERTVTMQKDSSGHVGFLYKNGKITDLVKDSSAARNGLLTDHQMCEINGQNVVGMKVNRIYSQIRILQQNYM